VTDDPQINIIVVVIPERKQPDLHKHLGDVVGGMDTRSIVIMFGILSIVFIAPLVTILLLYAGK